MSPKFFEEKVFFISLIKLKYIVLEPMPTRILLKYKSGKEFDIGKRIAPTKKKIEPNVITRVPPNLSTEIPINNWQIAYIYINAEPKAVIYGAEAFKSLCKRSKTAPGIATRCMLAKKYKITPTVISIICFFFSINYIPYFPK